MAEEVIIAPGANSTISRKVLGGWEIHVIVGGNNKQIAFTDSVDMIDWLSAVVFRSDGGKTKANWEANNVGGPSTAPAAPG